jgi:hypothetical protein
MRIKLFEELNNHEIELDPRFEIPAEFMDRITNLRELISLGLMDRNKSIFYGKPPTIMFAQYDSGQWVLVRLYQTGTVTQKTDSEGNYRGPDHNPFSEGMFNQGYIKPAAPGPTYLKRPGLHENVVPTVNDPSDLEDTIAQLRKMAEAGLAEYPLRVNDQFGRKIYTEGEDGDASWYEYSDDSKVVTCKDIEGNWYRETIDPKTGMRTKFENSKGFWETHRVWKDAKGNEFDRIENAFGKFTEKKYGPDHRLISVKKDPETIKHERKLKQAEMSRLRVKYGSNNGRNVEIP